MLSEENGVLRRENERLREKEDHLDHENAAITEKLRMATKEADLIGEKEKQRRNELAKIKEMLRDARVESAGSRATAQEAYTKFEKEREGRSDAIHGKGLAEKERDQVRKLAEGDKAYLREDLQSQLRKVAELKVKLKDAEIETEEALFKTYGLEKKLRLEEEKNKRLQEKLDLKEKQLIETRERLEAARNDRERILISEARAKKRSAKKTADTDRREAHLKELLIEIEDQERYVEDEKEKTQKAVEDQRAAERELKREQERVKDLKQKVADLIEDMEESDEQKRAYLTTIKDLKDDIRNMEFEIRNLEIENDRLDTRAANFSKDEIMVMREKERIQEDNAELQVRIKNLQDDSFKLKRDKREVQEKNEKLDEEIEDLRDQLAKQKNKKPEVDPKKESAMWEILVKAAGKYFKFSIHNFNKVDILYALERL